SDRRFRGTPSARHAPRPLLRRPALASPGGAARAGGLHCCEGRRPGVALRRLPLAPSRHLRGRTLPDERTDERIEQADGVSNHLKGLLNGGFGLIQGLGLTLRHLFEPPVTLQYPEERWVPAHGFRGIPVLTVDEAGELKC